VDEALELVRPDGQVVEPERAARGHEVQVRSDRDRERRVGRQRVVQEREIGYRRRAEVDDLGERVGLAALVDDVEVATGLQVRLRRLAGSAGASMLDDRPDAGPYRLVRSRPRRPVDPVFVGVAG